MRSCLDTLQTQWVCFSPVTRGRTDSPSQGELGGSGSAPFLFLSENPETAPFLALYFVGKAIHLGQRRKNGALWGTYRQGRGWLWGGTPTALTMSVCSKAARKKHRDCDSLWTDLGVTCCNFILSKSKHVPILSVPTSSRYWRVRGTLGIQN